MTQNPLMTAADYADAMLVARRAKTILFLLLLAVLLGQLAIFFAFRYALDPGAAAATQPTLTTGSLEYALALTSFAGMALVIVLVIVLLLIVVIMLVGRLVGVARLTSAFIWCLLLAVMLFPWQAVLLTPTSNADRQISDRKIPGVLYTWDELTHPTLGARFGEGFSEQTFLRWARFVAMPLVAVIVLLAVQVKSNRGLKLALGEAELPSSDNTLNV